MRGLLTRSGRGLCLAALLNCAACVASESWVELRDQRFTVEIADTREKQALGLMFRDHLPADHGMLFIFPSEAPRSFWMKNTRIPLDIIYFDAQLHVVGMALDARPCHSRRCPGYPSERPAKFVLELNAGRAEALGLELGDTLVLGFD